jgi:carbon monoxide dehydrogenase subunit G
MEHDAFVPFSVGVVRRALGEPDRVARCVSAVQRDTASPAGTLAGRLRLRIGGSSITYRGSLRIAECDGGFEIEGEGVESRGSGVVKVALVIGLDPEDNGTRLGFSGAVQAEGRLTEYDEATVEAAGRRLLDRFVTDLTTDLDAEPPAPTVANGVGPADSARDADRGPAADHDSLNGATGDAHDAGGEPATGAGDAVEAVNGSDADAVNGSDAAADPGSDADSDTDADSDSDSDDSVDVEVPETVAGLEDEQDGEEPPAEAAHARRTMIGRSAEEVDHAPPRGRYAPVAAPTSGSAGDTLRWAAPAAAALLASAVVVGRALRKRR